MTPSPEGFVRNDARPVVDLLLEASQGTTPSTYAPWDIGWSEATIRASGQASISTNGGPMSLNDDAMGLYEIAVEKLLKDQSIKRKWSTEDFWGYVASIVGQAAASTDPRAVIESGLSQLRSNRASFVAFALSNVAWKEGPVELDQIVIGPVGDMFRSLAIARLNDLPCDRRERFDQWHSELLSYRERLATGIGVPDIIVAFVKTEAKGFAATDEAELTFRRMVNLCLLLAETEYDESGRGGHHNMPSPRGDTFDRQAVAIALQASEHSDEMVTTQYYGNDFTAYASQSWYSSNPFPLSEALAGEETRIVIENCLARKFAIARRLEVASYWFGVHNWNTDDDMRMLALGVALDSLLGSPDALPGKALAERYALLGTTPEERPNRMKELQGIWAVRSSIAHGSRSSKLDREYVSYVSNVVKKTARELLALQAKFTPSSEKDFEKVLADLKWGIRSW